LINQPAKYIDRKNKACSVLEQALFFTGVNKLQAIDYLFNQNRLNPTIKRSSQIVLAGRSGTFSFLTRTLLGRCSSLLKKSLFIPE